ncbi:Biogenesis of lysosome-related organelles complex 1 subunit 3 [Carabus blaptoides fortunei]
MDNKVVIEGEAPETDSDEDIPLDSDVTPTRMNRSVHGAIIAGEASESEDEHGSSVSSAVSALTHPHIRSSTVKTVHPENEEKFNTLLHKKLKECNRSLHNNLQIFTHNVINEAARDLTSTDQQLLKSQVTLQAAVTSLRSLNHNASALKEKLDIVISSQFFPNVRLSHNK